MVIKQLELKASRPSIKTKHPPITLSTTWATKAWECSLKMPLESLHSELLRVQGPRAVIWQ